MAKRKKKRSHPILTFFLSIFLIGILTGAMCGMAFAAYVRSYIIPEADIDIDMLGTLGMNLTSFIYAKDPATGEYKEYEKIDSAENRIWVDMDQIPYELGQAFVAIEDQRFYSHEGVDWKRTLGAVKSYITGQSSYGGSTITQQLIKNVTNDKDVSVKRKINEIFRALALEKKINDKDRILEMYMNVIYLGRGAYGVQAAAQTYFAKDVSELSLAECAIIASITNAPSYYDPFKHPDHAKQRQELVLEEMYEQGMISRSQCDRSKLETLVYQQAQSEAADSKPYSYFTDTVYNDVVNDLVQRKGYTKETARRLVSTGGLQIYATVNTYIQSVMDNVYADDSNFPRISKNGTSPESAMVILNKDGSIAGIVGGRGVKTGSLVLNRANSPRQPGSSIKPISVYGPAMDAGIITPYTGMVDEPYTKVDGKDWPRNDNYKYTGNILLKNAVARSVNTIAVKVLAELTPEASYNFLTQKLGITTLVGSRTTASGSVKSDISLAPLALGGLTDGLTVREMAGAYNIFLNGGLFYQVHSYSKVLDSSGAVLLSYENQEPIVAFENEKTSYYMNETLQGVTTSGGTAASAKIPGMDTAGKTGTTTSNRDRWFCGYTPYYVGVCWFGYDQNYQVTGVGYTNPATSLWKAVMTKIHEGYPNASFPAPGDGFSRQGYCTLTGLLPSSGCTTATGYFYTGDAPTEQCHGHVGAGDEESSTEVITDENGLPVTTAPQDVTNVDGTTETTTEGTEPPDSSQTTTMPTTSGTDVEPEPEPPTTPPETQPTTEVQTQPPTEPVTQAPPLVADPEG